MHAYWARILEIGLWISVRIIMCILLHSKGEWDFMKWVARVQRAQTFLVPLFSMWSPKISFIIIFQTPRSTSVIEYMGAVTQYKMVRYLNILRDSNKCCGVMSLLVIMSDWIHWLITIMSVHSLSLLLHYLCLFKKLFFTLFCLSQDIVFFFFKSKPLVQCLTWLTHIWPNLVCLSNSENVCGFHVGIILLKDTY